MNKKKEEINKYRLETIEQLKLFSKNIEEMRRSFGDIVLIVSECIDRARDFESAINDLVTGPGHKKLRLALTAGEGYFKSVRKLYECAGRGEAKESARFISEFLSNALKHPPAYWVLPFARFESSKCLGEWLREISSVRDFATRGGRAVRDEDVIGTLARSAAGYIKRIRELQTVGKELQSEIRNSFIK